MGLDEESIKNQLALLFTKLDEIKEDVIKLKVNQANLMNGHDDHKEKITKNSDLLTRISIGGCVVLYIADEMGLFDAIL